MSRRMTEDDVFGIDICQRRKYVEKEHDESLFATEGKNALRAEKIATEHTVMWYRT